MGMRASVQGAGQFIAAHYTDNMEGLNLTDSPFAVRPGQATGGFNYEYAKTGGFRKCKTPVAVNSVADAELKSRGFNLYHTKTGVKAAIRMAGSRFQILDMTSGSITNLTEDTASAGSSFFTSADTQAYSYMFTTPSSDVLWTASSALPTVYGVCSTSKVTKNGVSAPTGSISASVTQSGGSWTVTGTYYYSVAFRKASTQALSNADLDVSASVGTGVDTVTIDLSGITNLDATKYDKIYIYRSSVNGAEGFTAGSLIAQLDPATTSYADTGSSIASSQNVPRAGNTILDNSELTAASYTGIAIWKRRLVVASESSLYFSDINKPESWPEGNSIVVPTGGKITGIAAIGYNHPGGSSTDEFLAVFKENECWIITGDSADDWELNFVDYTGCAQQNLLVNANGFLFWIDRRGVYVWDGSGKPVYVSRPIEYLFGDEGTIDKSQLGIGCGDFYRSLNQVIWYLSSTIEGTQKYILKLDLRLTLPQVKNALGEKVLEGVFMQGKCTQPAYAVKSIQSPIGTENRDYFLTGDADGYAYKALFGTTGSGNDVDFSYTTAHLDQGRPMQAKRYHKVIAWVDQVGNFPVRLDYWTDYRVRDGEKSSVSTTISSEPDSELSIWDLGYWDTAYWDDLTPTLTPLVFNLAPGSVENNNEGDAIRLSFVNANSGQPITVNAFTILYTELGVRK